MATAGRFGVEDGENGSLPGALGEGAAPVLHRTVPAVVPGTDDRVNGTANGTANGTVNGILRAPMNGSVPGTTDGILNGHLNGTVNGTAKPTHRQTAYAASADEVGHGADAPQGAFIPAPRRPEPADASADRAADRATDPCADRTAEDGTPLRPQADLDIPARRAPAAAWERQYVATIVAFDMAVALVAGLVAYAVRFGTPGPFSWPYLVGSLLSPLAWTFVLTLTRAYEPRFLFIGNEEYRRVLNAGVGLTAALAVAAYYSHTEVARGYVVLAIPLLTVATLCSRYLQRGRLLARRRRGECMRRVIVIGYARPVANLCRQLRRERYHGMEVVGACLPHEQVEQGHVVDLDVPVFGSFDAVGAAVRAARADTVAVLPCPEMDSFALRDLCWELERTKTDLMVATALLDIAGPRTSIRPVDGLPMLHVEPAELTGGRRLVKNLFDFVLASAALAVLLPVILVLAGLVRLTSKGPAFFTQTRVGKDGREFTLYKLRTMYVDAEQRLAELSDLNEHDGLMFKIRRDPRVTPIGRWLRRYSLDEVPQFLNVVLGQMSLVGPRPPLPAEVAQYLRHAHRRLVVKPGITGLWQVSGRSNLSWEDTVRLDLRYVENWSLTFDLVIMLRTITAMIRASGAY